MRTRLSFVILLLVAPGLLGAQNPGGLDPAELLKPLGASWPTYSGDYTGRRYSSLALINQTNVTHLSLAWTARVANGPGPVGGGGGFGGRAAGPPVQLIVGGEGTGEFAAGDATSIKGAVLEVNGILYFSAPDNAWAMDARDGRVLWHYYWKTRGGTHIGNRGMAMWHNDLYMETPDDYLVSLDARTGQERWHVVIADFNQQYFSTMAPVVIGDHLIVGTGDDLDAPGFLQSFDPDTGKLQWKFYTVPMNAGDPGLETWPNLESARHGGAQPWIPGAYDPETHLYIFGTGNPTPAYTVGREGDNLYTCSLVAVNVDTGKMAWYYQTSPHDTHDWDSTQTPILIDAPINGHMTKLALQATRNGYYFTLDRVTGEHIASSKFSIAANWAKGFRKDGAPDRDPEKDATIPGSLVSPTNGGTTNWPPPAFSPDTGLFYVPDREDYAMYYLNDPDPRGSMGLGGKTEVGVGTLGHYLAAIDYKTGNVVWRHRYPGGAEGPGGGGTGMLTTAGKLLFANDAVGNLVAFDPANGRPLWHSHIGSGTNAPETYLLDGRQYILQAVGDMLYAFVLNE
jgi:alcohol dehydrogenase (cytochrome c)